MSMTDTPAATNLHVRRGLTAQEAGDFEAALEHFQRAVRVPPAVPAALFHLGHCHLKAAGDRAVNARHAMNCFREGLERFPESEAPVDHALFRESLGDACLPAGDAGPAGASEAALGHHEQALAIFRHVGDTAACARVLDKLGHDYCERRHGDRCRNLRRAARCFADAVAANEVVDDGRRWALSMTNLGTVCRDLAPCSGPQLLGRALSCYAAALRVRTRPRDPEGHAALENNIANVYMTPPLCDDPARCRQAVELYRDALRVRTRQAHPADYALTCYNLGQAYLQLARGRGGGLRSALRCFEDAAEVAAGERLDRIETLARRGLARARRQVTPETAAVRDKEPET